jgi:hypothetical protein
LKAGSSKPGNAVRALIGSNCENTYASSPCVTLKRPSPPSRNGAVQASESVASPTGTSHGNVTRATPVSCTCA